MMEKHLLGSFFLYVFPAKFFSLPPILWAPKGLQSSISLLKAANIHFLCMQSSKWLTLPHRHTHKAPLWETTSLCRYTDQDNTMVVLSLANFRQSSPFAGSFTSTCFRTWHAHTVPAPLRHKSQPASCYFTTWDFLSQGPGDMFLKHKVKTDKMPVFLTLEAG